MAMTNAERQKRYRDKKRGGPPEGRWHDHHSYAQLSAIHGVSRSMLYMGKWLHKHAPESVVADIESGKIKHLASVYKKIRKEAELDFFRALVAAKADEGRDA